MLSYNPAVHRYFPATARITEASVKSLCLVVTVGTLSCALEGLLSKRCGTMAAVARACAGLVVNAPSIVAGDEARYLAS